MAINCGMLSTFLIFLGAVAVGVSLVAMPESHFTLGSAFGVSVSLKVKPLGDCDFCMGAMGVEECYG